MRNFRPRWLRGPRNGHDVAVVLGDRLKAAVLIAKVIKVRVRKMRPATLGVNFKNGHDTVGIAVRQRPQQYTINSAENCRGRSDTKCEGQHSDASESLILGQRARAVTQVLQDRLHVSSFLRWQGLPAGGR